MFRVPWQQLGYFPDVGGGESTEYAGRAMVALATDPKVVEKMGAF
jgi:hypothetical protein